MAEEKVKDEPLKVEVKVKSNLLKFLTYLIDIMGYTLAM